ncbi:Oxoglutarate/iron-dependent dioxygenase [Penicillium manginii]|jgi:isopenicillin N synthase-like dioxygenase|uniref:Oxoglutarate/iron-dependent dioxygenase n=1 Tax=Penicillium manginii TaxID=203109 RepID=UPI0025469756|nr:Oxoglutarate/iron-dependent dioxygenase [Penicillium manginii]KAJ5744670.1 Oxoglutarate/iron-dependent dioxygenase [Penicillium manginii]
MPISTESSFYLPAVDISPYLEDPNSEGARKVIDDVRAACQSTGFFQLLGHGISPALQQSVFAAAARFFDLPREVKSRCKGVGFRGYDPMASQSYEEGVLPDLKEGFISGTDIPIDDPRVVSRRFFMGPNVWPPSELLAEEDFRYTIEEYYEAILKLCWLVLDLVAATLPYGPHVFDEFKENDPACPLRLLHYPPTPEMDLAKGRQLGSSAHTDFGAITLLLQDENAGLEVQDHETGEWIGVPPNKDAYVVNLGDMISRITRGNYRSSTHRVINKNPTDRYSVVFFFDGNVDYKLRPLDRVGQDSDEEDVLTVEEHMVERTTTTYKHKAK